MSKNKEQIEDPLLEIFMARRAVVLSGDINDASVGEVGRRMIQLQDQSHDPIDLIFDSGGGSTNVALSFCDLIARVLVAPVRGIALGDCGSAATFIMLHCSERIGTPYSRFLIHSGTQSNISIPIGQTTSEKVTQLQRGVKATEEMVLDLYVNLLTPTAWSEKKPKLKKRRKFVQKLIDRGDQSFDYWMTAKEAVEAGLITKVVHEKLDIFKK